jgi:uncharacterized protein (TIGR04222 family)
MLDVINEIPMPIYLLIYAIIVMFCYLIGWVIIHSDGSLKYPLPEVNKINPYQIAALRGGRKAVIRTAAFNLWNRKLLRLESSNTGSNRDSGYSNEIELQSVPTQNINFNPIEYEVHDYFKMKTIPSEMFQDLRFQNRIDRRLVHILTELKYLYLIRTKSDQIRMYITIIVIFIIFLFTAGIKIYFCVINDMSFYYLSIEFVVSVVLLPVLLKPNDEVTRLGHTYLTKLENHYSWINTQIQNDNIKIGIDPTYYVAIFGFRFLIDNPIYKAFVHSMFTERYESDHYFGPWDTFSDDSYFDV